MRFLRRGLAALARVFFGGNTVTSVSTGQLGQGLGFESLERRRMFASLAGTVYVDHSNAALSSSDFGLAGVTVTLTGATTGGGSVTPQSVKTASDGTYSFSGLAAGTYNVAISQPTKIEAGSVFFGSLGGTAETHSIANIAVGANDTGTGYNFAEIGLPISEITLGLFLDSTPSAQTYLDQLVTSSSSALSPAVASIVLASANPTKATSVNYTVNFNEAVTGVNANDFSLNSSSTITGASITSVTGSGSTYTVAVATGSTNGTIGLNLVDKGDIFSTTGQALGTDSGAVLFTGPSYTVNFASVAITSVTSPVNNTNDTNAAASGTADAGDSISLTATDGTHTTSAVTATANSSGIWSISGINVSSLNDGTITFNVTATTSAGDTATGALTATKNTVAPTVAITSPSAVTASNAASFTISGTGTANANISLTASDSKNNTTSAFTTTVGSGGTWSITNINLSSLNNGTITFKVTATEPTFGNTASTTATTSDTASTVTVALSTAPTSLNSTNDTAVAVAGTSTASASIVVTATDSTGATATGTATANSSGAWTANVDVAGLADGTITFTATATGTLGATATAPSSLTATKNTVTPSLAITSVTNPIDNANDTAVAVSGTGTVGGTVSLVASDSASTPNKTTTYTATVQSNGQWSITGINTSGLVNGTVTITATITDTFGNTHTTTTTTTQNTAIPTITAPTTQTTPLNTALVFSSSNGNPLSITENNLGSNSVQLALSSTEGTLTLSTTSGLTVTSGANNSAAVTVTGTLSAINAALAGLTFTPTTAFSGAATLTLNYSDLGNGGSSTAQTASQTVNIAVNAPATTISASVASTTFGESVTFTATLAAVSPATGMPTGTVTFMDGTTTLGTGTLSGGVATFTTSALTAGSHSITAVYSGDSNFAANQSSAFAYTVNQAATTTALVSSAVPAALGQSITFTATLAAVSPGAGTPSGTVTFKDGTTTLGTATLNSSGVATFTTSSLSEGTHSITAVYGGDTNFTTSTSTAVPQIVGQAAAPTISTPATQTTPLNAVLGLSTADGNLISVADVSAGSNTVQLALTATNGKLTLATTSGLTITSGANNSAAMTITGTLAEINTALDDLTFTPTTGFSGAASINIEFSDLGIGGVETAQTASSTLTIEVNVPSIAVTASASSVVYGQSESFTATLAAISPATGIPTGTVTFMDGDTTLGTSSLNSSGVATFTTNSSTLLAAGSHSITVVYGGDTNFAADTSNAITITVTPAALTIDTVSEADKTFDGGTTGPNPTITLSGVIGSDVVTASGTATFASADVGSGITVNITGITLSGAAAANYTLATTTATTTAKITQATPTVDVTEAGGAFTGDAFSATATVTGVSGTAADSLETVSPTLTYFSGSAASGTPLSGAPSAVGTYTVVASFAGSTDYASATSSPVTFTITQATPTVDVTEAGGAFTGDAFTATATVTGVSGTAADSLETVSPTLAYFSGSTATGTPLSGAPSAIGTYTVVASFAGSTDYAAATSSPVTFTIAEATPTVDVTEAGGAFTGNAFSATATVTGVSGTPADSLETVSPTLAYFSGATATGTPLSGAPSAVGTYTVVASFAGSTDYAAATSSPVTFTITQATPTVDVTEAGGAFTGDAFSATATVTGVSGTPADSLESVTPTLSYFSGSTATGSPLSGAPSAAGTYTVVASFAGSSDYAAATSSPVTFTIAPATPTVDVTEAGGAFTGDAFSATATVTGVSGSPADSLETVSPTLSYFSGSTATGAPLSGAPSAAGTYTVVASFAGSADYAAATSSPVTFTITQATPTVDLTAVGGTFTGDAFTATATVTGVSGTAAASLETVSPTLTYFSGSTATGAPLSGAPSAVGTYTVVANFAGSTDYSAATSSPLTFTISQATPTLGLTAVGGTFTGDAFSATATVAGVSGTAAASLETVSPTLTYFSGSTATGTPLSGAPSTAGTYTVVASFAGSTDYAAATSNPLTFTISQATPTVDVTDAGGTFTGNPFPATATVTGVSGTPAASLETVSPTLTYFSGSTATGTPLSGAPSAVGAYTVVASFAGSTDYASATSSPVTFAITSSTQPMVSSITLPDANPVTAGTATVDFTVTFNEAVTGVSTSTFAALATGLTGSSIESVTGSGSDYTVTVNVGSGSGDLRLEQVADSSVMDSSNNTLNGAFTGPAYTIS